MQPSPSSESSYEGPLRVLFVNDTRENGAAGATFHTILKFLDPRVIHRTVVLARRGPASERLEQARAADEVIIEPNLVESPIEPWKRAISEGDFDAPRGRKSLRFLGNLARAAVGMRRLSELAKRGAYDLIYCNGASADFAGGILSAATSVPTLWHVHYTSIPSLVAPIHRLLSASAGVRRIVCASRAAAALFPHCREKIRVMHKVVDTEEWSPSSVAPRLREELGYSADTVVFGAHGQIVRREGIREFLGAAKLALAHMTRDEAARARFVVVGAGVDGGAAIRGSGLEDHVRVLEARVDARPYIADFDVAVATSSESPSRSILEAMAMGKPVIGFDEGGIGEVIDESITGTLVSGSPPDVGALAAQMLRYQRHPDLRARHGAAARARVERSVDARRHARAIQGEIVRAAGEARPC
jgi:glycosyltransferase involved in cell wall biosynthesis